MILPISCKEWLSIDEAHPAPTFFARPAWTLALCAAFPHWQPYPVQVRTTSGTLLLPLVRAAGGRARWREVAGFPLGGYTYGLREDGSPAAAGALTGAIEELASTYDSVRLSLWPLAPQPPRGEGWRARVHETALIDLAGGAEAAIQRFDGVSRRMARQAIRRGVVCCRCDDTGAASRYYEILEEAAGSWGLAQPAFPNVLLQRLVEYGRGNVEIWFACYEGAPIAGGVVLFGASEMFFWSAAMRRSHAALRPSNALNVALITAAAQRGLRWYNLGSSEGLPGVARFKRGLGAQPVRYTEIAHERPLYTFYTRIRASLKPAGAGP